jgi:transposase
MAATPARADGTLPNIPPRANQVWKSCFSPVLYRARNAIEGTIGRLKNCRRVAIRSNRLATSLVAAVCLAAAVSHWS